MFRIDGLQRILAHMSLRKPKVVSACHLLALELISGPCALAFVHIVAGRWLLRE